MLIVVHPQSTTDSQGELESATNKGRSALSRYRKHGEKRDLEHSVAEFERTLRDCPPNHPCRAAAQSNLATAKFILCQVEDGDLLVPLGLYHDALAARPIGHPDRSSTLIRLAAVYFARFQKLRDEAARTQAEVLLHEAMKLSSADSHANRVTPFMLKLHSGRRVGPTERIGQLLVEQGSASRLTDEDLHDLSVSLLRRFKRFGDLADLQQAVGILRELVRSTSPWDDQYRAGLGNLGVALLCRFERLGNQADLDEGISRLGDAYDVTPDGHHDRLSILNNLSISFLTRFECLGHQSDMEHAILLFFRAASDLLGPATVRFRASQNWITCARAIRHPSLLHAYSVSINILPQLAWNGLSFSARYTELARGANMVWEAAAAALESSLPETAVEWLEQGRSIVWGDLFQLRSSHEDLSFSYPDRALRLRELSAALEYASATHEKSLSALSEPTPSATRSLQQEADRHRALAIERDNLLLDIRKLPGFERFLLQKDFSQLRVSTHSGPVVILNAAEIRCDALIVLPNVDHVIHVPLPQFSLKQSAGLQKTLQGFLRQAREGRLAPLEGVSWESFLSPLWRHVVKPVDALGFSVRDAILLEFKAHLFIYLEQTPGDLSRIFWCPTGPFTFLPIHAAGIYDTVHPQPGDKVFDFVVSSYTPSLSILARSANHDTVISRELRLLAVRQPPSDGQQPLRGVVTELEYIKEVIKNSACITLLESSVGTVEEVLGLMKEVDWVHFACHGIQDPTGPTKSGLCLANKRRLKVSDMITLSRSRGGLAFLSACETATGDKDLSDEAIHIAAGMLFAGYSGVIGTMWSISDRLAPDVARDVYEELFRDDKRPDSREAARALHEAIKCARDHGEAFVDWVPFIHVGL